ncbi:MAG: PAS domain-containing protein [Chitinophagaceae bacterium]
MITPTHPLNILVVEDNPGDYFLFCEYIRLSQLPVKQIFHADRLSDALNLVRTHDMDLVFLDLSLPDSNGPETFKKLNNEIPNISIIVLSGLDDTGVALKTIAMGAQDYLVKGDFDEKLLGKTIQYSIERKKILQHVVENLERYNTIIKATNDTIWDWDLRTNEISWNEGITTIFGYIPQGKLTTIDWHHQHIHADDRGRILEKINQCLQNGDNQWQEEYRYRAATGEYRYVFDRGYILKNDQQKAYRMLGAITDVTERKRRHEELLRHQLEMQKLVTQVTIQTQEQERSEIGRELHDNINQILATAKLCIDMALNEEMLRPELLKKSHDSLAKAIQEIRTLSKTLVPPSLGDLGLKEALLEMIETMKLNPQLQIKIGHYDAEVESISGNKKLFLYRIVQEQINNILKHSKATTAEIELVCNEQTLHMLIRDNGIGFDPTVKSRGIGMSNITNRVEMQNGNMEIISSSGTGCLLKIEIPLEG